MPKLRRSVGEALVLQHVQLLIEVVTQTLPLPEELVMVEELLLVIVQKQILLVIVLVLLVMLVSTGIQGPSRVLVGKSLLQKAVLLAVLLASTPSSNHLHHLPAFLQWGLGAS